MECSDARRLVPAYLDGELSEAQAGPLRKHLLGCHPCRGSAQDLRALRRWFEGPAEGEAGGSGVPPGFASRVARRAFAGDTGERRPAAAPALQERERLLRFVLQATALAAGLLLVLSLAIRMQGLPAGEKLHASDGPLQPVAEILGELERLDERRAAASGAAPAPAGAGSERPEGGPGPEGAARASRRGGEGR